MRITKQILQVLAVFLEKPGKQFSGSDIRRQTNLSTGTLYPILCRLEQHGWLESEWEKVEPKEVGRPRKRLYQLTKNGFVKAQSELNLLSWSKKDGLVTDF